MQLGENICRLRTAENMSQGDLADALEVSRQSISKWETGASVPELDKLMKLAALFGVTLDELVTGEKPETETPAAPPPQVIVEQPGMPPRQVAGTVLLGMAFAVALVFTLLAGLPSGLVLCLPFLICGLICLAAKQHPALWCLWALFLLADGYLRTATGTSWAAVRHTFQWTAQDNYFVLVIAWCQLLCALALLGGTVWRLGREPRARTRRELGFFIGGWAAFLLLGLPFSTWILRAGGLELAWLVRLVGFLRDGLRLALLAGLLAAPLRWRRASCGK